MEALLDLIETLNLNPRNLGDKLNIDELAGVCGEHGGHLQWLLRAQYYLYQDEQGLSNDSMGSRQFLRGGHHRVQLLEPQRSLSF